MANNEKKALGIILVSLIVVGAYLSYDYFLKEDVVEEDDIVQINYIAWIKDTEKVFATTIVNETNITKDTPLDDSHRYRPISVTIGSGEASKGTIKVIEGLDEGLRGLKVGDLVEIEIPPEKGYQPNPDLIYQIERSLETLIKEQATDRYQTYDRSYSITSDDYTDTYGKSPQVGDKVNLVGWIGTVTTIDSEGNVTIRSDPDIGDTIVTLPWSMSVVEVTEDSLTLEFVAEIGESYQNAYGTVIVDDITEDEIIFHQDTLIDQIETIYGMADIIDHGDSFELFVNPDEGKIISSADGYATITNITDTTFDLDYNPAYVGNTIVYKVKIEKIIKAEN